MSQSFVKGTIILTVGTIISKVLGSIFRIPLQNIAGDKVLGIFSLVYPLYMVALILSVAGIPIAVSKLISEARARQKEDEVARLVQTASLLAFSFGVLSFSLLAGGSSWIAKALGGPEARFAIVVVSTTLLISPYMAVYRGFFQGLENMKPTAASQVLEQFVRVAFILLVAFYMVQAAYRDDIVAGGIMIGSPLGALASLIYLRVLYARSPHRPKRVKLSRTQWVQTSKTILKLSIPIALGALAMPFLNLVDSLSVPIALRWYGAAEGETSYLFGLYSRGTALVQIATVFSSSLVLPLIPLLSKQMAKGETTQAQQTVQKSFELSHFLSWPMAAGLAGLTVPLNIALFTNHEGSLTMAVVLASSVFTSLALLGTGILQGIGESKRAAVIILIGCIVKWGTNILFVSIYGLIGAGISTVFTYAFITWANHVAIRRRISLPFWSRKVVVYVAASVMMGVGLFFISPTWGRLASFGYVTAATVAGGLFYLGVVLALGGVTLQQFRQWLNQTKKG
ncbi:polysaccharide biosynthesis/transport protein [Anoxybacillus gonensis]|uniref:Polysaccharide biosynthesis protein n=1 Tax=Anoxybacillus gonensis TaxID=198467 RepID=A0AAW7TJ43_9BACL|nr:polysaccharide biosynthesis protein [Anoxybacillus gonensis]AKS39567.1 polysaccharide biosynthesis/transport protein [Anoxybacillus gonensis]KGP59630.1 polysaccharide biosynthesis/transport protein [Anoxybacillus gonensis]MCX8046171.1 polysaccharide biosynthesis protein [Anoxybacillus gonensis]MDO0878415.1 polysaccharide biosynthesis protein [Anoxybacillus gonensis]